MEYSKWCSMGLRLMQQEVVELFGLGIHSGRESCQLSSALPTRDEFALFFSNLQHRSQAVCSLCKIKEVFPFENKTPPAICY